MLTWGRHRGRGAGARGWGFTPGPSSDTCDHGHVDQTRDVRVGVLELLELHNVRDSKRRNHPPALGVSGPNTSVRRAALLPRVWGKRFFSFSCFLPFAPSGSAPPLGSWPPLLSSSAKRPSTPFLSLTPFPSVLCTDLVMTPAHPGSAGQPRTSRASMRHLPASFG